jgi:hypothetical protein
MAAFRPLGDRARWRTLYGLLRERDIGDVLTYDAMADALELDAKADRHTMQMAMRRAARELETVDKRAVEPVLNIGYRIVEPAVHIELARRHQRKANTSLARGQSKVVNVDFNQLDPETCRAFEIVAAAFAAQIDFNRRMDVRQQHLERAVESVTQRSARTEEELAALRDRLRRLEETSGSE